MRSKKWTRQNKERGAKGFLAIINTVAGAIAVASIISLTTNWDVYIYEQFGISLYFFALLVGCLGSLSYWLVQNFSHANELSRVIKMPYEDVDFALRKMFKEKQLTFVRRTNEADCYVYAMTGRDVSLTIIPYDSSISSFGSPERPSNELTSYNHTLLQIPDLHDNNKPFAEELAVHIDGIVA